MLPLVVGPVGVTAIGLPVRAVAVCPRALVAALLVVAVAILLATTFGAMMPNCATHGGAQQTVVPSHMAGDPADSCARQAARLCRRSEPCRDAAAEQHQNGRLPPGDDLQVARLHQLQNDLQSTRVPGIRFQTLIFHAEAS